MNRSAVGGQNFKKAVFRKRPIDGTRKTHG
jgi:hypothetical protein